MKHRQLERLAEWDVFNFFSIKMIIISSVLILSSLPFLAISDWNFSKFVYYYNFRGPLADKRILCIPGYIKLIAIGMVVNRQWNLGVSRKIYAYTRGQSERIAWTGIGSDNSRPRVACLVYTHSILNYTRVCPITRPFIWTLIKI